MNDDGLLLDTIKQAYAGKIMEGSRIIGICDSVKMGMLSRGIFVCVLGRFIGLKEGHSRFVVGRPLTLMVIMQSSRCRLRFFCPTVPVCHSVMLTTNDPG